MGKETCDGSVTIAYASRFLNKAEEKHSTNKLELLGVVWALEHFKLYLLGQKFTVKTDHRALLSILKERSSKVHQSRITRWCDRLIPYIFNIEQIAGSKMGLANFMSQNPNDLPKAPTKYDDEFIIAQINIIKNTLNIIRKRGRPRKNTIDTEQTEQKNVKRRGRPRKNTTTAQDNIPHNNNNAMESCTIPTKLIITWNRPTIPQTIIYTQIRRNETPIQIYKTAEQKAVRYNNHAIHIITAFVANTKTIPTKNVKQTMTS